MKSANLRRTLPWIACLSVGVGVAAFKCLQPKSFSQDALAQPSVPLAHHLRMVDDTADTGVTPSLPPVAGLSAGPGTMALSLLMLLEDPDDSSSGNPPPAADAFKPFADQIKLRWDDRYLYVGSNGMPKHQLMVGITNWQQQVPLPQSYFGDNAWQIPLHPIPAEKPIPIKNRFLRGAIALAVDGVPIFNPQNNRGEISQDIGELDQFGGHCGRGDDYHYHAAPLFLEKIVGPGKPIAYALDGYPIYGSTGPDGKPVDEKTLDPYRGKVGPDGSYAYYASKKYPFVFSAFHGQVTERGGQVDPQPSAQPVRPAGRPLRGANITGFKVNSPTSFTLKYEYDEAICTINYWINSDGTYHFQFIDGQGNTQEQVYRRGRRGNPPPQR